MIIIIQITDLQAETLAPIVVPDKQKGALTAVDDDDGDNDDDSLERWFLLV